MPITKMTTLLASILWALPFVKAGCEDFPDITSCQEIAGCTWRTGQRICFGTMNTFPFFEIHRGVRCESDDIDVTTPVVVQVTALHSNDSMDNCTSPSAEFVTNSPGHYISYGTFDNCSFPSSSINESTIQYVYVFCDSNNAWEPCIQFNHNLMANPKISRYHCQCGQLHYTKIPKVVDYGGLSHHGLYTYYGTMDRIDRDYPTCTQIFTLHLHHI